MEALDLLKALKFTNGASVISGSRLHRDFPHCNSVRKFPIAFRATLQGFSMLRRKPTAITITSEDIAAFEEAYARKLAYQKFLKTGEDPSGYFTAARGGELDWTEQQMRLAQQRQGRSDVMDPNDELKPLPGDKARIVRSREERIVGTGGGGR